jgi:2-keto-4-pentenoate hydratase/2-oxohepta-3-ene-1,7-dioic acid hydratase in catechol pathway
MISEEVANTFGMAIVQVLGVAYTYRPSLMVRRHLTKNLVAHHSSRNGNFSYFYKGDKSSVFGTEEPLTLRTDPATGNLAQHWPEPELAVLLGHDHEIIAYTLANDLTAIGIETRGRSEQQDSTYLGKVWKGSGSLGPQFLPTAAIEDPEELTIGLRVMREGKTIYDRQYSTSRREKVFTSIPSAIVDYYRQFDDPVPLSKQICLCPSGRLPAGTVVMLGSGLIVRQEYYCQPGDILTVYCSEIGELTNAVI